MEKKFIQSMLFSTTIMVVYAMVSLPLPLSAEGNVTFDESAPARKGIIVNIGTTTQEFIVNFNGISVPVLVNASTTITSSNGLETEFSSLREGSAIYVFGNYDTINQNIDAKKIVMRNRSPMERKTLSRAEWQQVGKLEKVIPSPLNELSLNPR